MCSAYEVKSVSCRCMHKRPLQPVKAFAENLQFNSGTDRQTDRARQLQADKATGLFIWAEGKHFGHTQCIDSVAGRGSCSLIHLCSSRSTFYNIYAGACQLDQHSWASSQLLAKRRLEKSQCQCTLACVCVCLCVDCVWSTQHTCRLLCMHIAQK